MKFLTEKDHANMSMFLQKNRHQVTDSFISKSKWKWLKWPIDHSLYLFMHKVCSMTHKKSILICQIVVLTEDFSQDFDKKMVIPIPRTGWALKTSFFANYIWKICDFIYDRWLISHNSFLRRPDGHLRRQKYKEVSYQMKYLGSFQIQFGGHYELLLQL